MISANNYTDKLTEIKNLAIPSKTIDPEQEPVFNVDLNTRKITVPNVFRNLAVEGDHNAEMIWFAFDPYFDGQELEKKAVGLQFTNAVGRTGMLGSNFRSMHTGANNKKTLLLGWYVTKELTEAAGLIEISIRFYDISDVTMTYSLGTEPVRLTILEGLYVTSESENLTPPVDSLSQLVSRIEEIYQNNQATAIDYNVANNKPKINGSELRGNMYTSKADAESAFGSGFGEHYIPIAYEGLEGLPKINGHFLTPDSTSKSLEISVDVDAELDRYSTNPVQNKIIALALDAIEEDLAMIKEEMDGMTYIPLSIGEFYHTYGLAEKGSTVDSVGFNWKINGNAVEIKINDKAVDLTQTSTTLEGLNIKQDTDFTLVAKDNKGTTASATDRLLFAYKVFKGALTLPLEYNADFITNSLEGELQLTRESNFNVNADVGEFIYFAVPAEYGNCTFTSGGFSGGFTKVATIPYSNQYNATTDYDIWKSDYSGLGDTNVIVS